MELSKSKYCMYEYMYTLLDYYKINIFLANNNYTLLFSKLTDTEECLKVV